MSDEDRSPKVSTYGWDQIREMWAGLGIFLIIVIFLVFNHLGNDSDRKIEQQKIEACQYAPALKVTDCIKAVGK